MSWRRAQVLTVMSDKPDHLWSINDVAVACGMKNRAQAGKLLHDLAEHNIIDRILVQPPGSVVTQRVLYRVPETGPRKAQAAGNYGTVLKDLSDQGLAWPMDAA